MRVFSTNFSMTDKLKWCFLFGDHSDLEIQSCSLSVSVNEVTCTTISVLLSVITSINRLSDDRTSLTVGCQKVKQVLIVPNSTVSGLKKKLQEEMHSVSLVQIERFHQL